MTKFALALVLKPLGGERTHLPQISLVAICNTNLPTFFGGKVEGMGAISTPHVPQTPKQ